MLRISDFRSRGNREVMFTAVLNECRKISRAGKSGFLARLRSEPAVSLSHQPNDFRVRQFRCPLQLTEAGNRTGRQILRCPSKLSGPSVDTVLASVPAAGCRGISHLSGPSGYTMRLPKRKCRHHNNSEPAQLGNLRKAGVESFYNSCDDLTM